MQFCSRILAIVRHWVQSLAQKNKIPVYIVDLKRAFLISPSMSSCVAGKKMLDLQINQFKSQRNQLWGWKRTQSSERHTHSSTRVSFRIGNKAQLSKYPILPFCFYNQWLFLSEVRLQRSQAGSGPPADIYKARGVGWHTTQATPLHNTLAPFPLQEQHLVAMDTIWAMKPQTSTSTSLHLLLEKRGEWLFSGILPMKCCICHRIHETQAPWFYDLAS